MFQILLNNIIIFNYSMIQHNSYDIESYSIDQLNGQFTTNNLKLQNNLSQFQKHQFQKKQSEFYQKFLYGTELQMIRNEKIKKVNVFLDPTFQNLLWISKKGKAFVIDLSFSKIGITLLNSQLYSSNVYGLSLHHLSQNHTFAFQIEKQRKEMYRIISNYIYYIKLKYKLSINHSKTIKTYAQYNFIHGACSQNVTKQDMLKIASFQFSDRQPAEIEKILEQCITKFGQSQNSIPNTVKNAFSMILSCPDQLKNIYEEIAQVKIDSHLSKLQLSLDRKIFQNFLKKKQLLKEDQIKAITKKFNSQLSFYDFCSYIQNQNLNYAVVPPAINPNLPLNDYFCYSSHNTYLTGNQLTSQSKAQRYSQDLMNGIKCVEIDAHNKGDNVIVTHALKGFSLSKYVSLEQVLKTVDDVTDTFDNYSPIILSIQDNTTKDLQHKMAQMLVRCFNKKIHIFHGTKSQIHTLKQLRGHILLKTSAHIQKVSKSMTIEQDQQPKSHKNISEMQKIQAESDYQYAKSHRKFLQQRQKGIIKKHKFDLKFTELSFHFLPIRPMAKITTLFKVKSISDHASTSYQCCSKSIGSLKKYTKEELQGYTKRSWLRIYPEGSEVFSNNYGICYPLYIGAQIIALNTQTTDDNQIMLQSYFTSGRHQNPYELGYVQKPIYLRSTSNLAQPKQNMKIKVQILTKKLKQKPVWKFYSVGSSYPIEKRQSLIQNFTTQHPNESFLIIKIGKYQDCLPLRFIKAGIRVISLRNLNFQPIGENIITSIQIQKYQEDNWKPKEQKHFNEFIHLDQD